MVTVPAIKEANPKLTDKQIVQLPISQVQPVTKDNIVRKEP